MAKLNIGFVLIGIIGVPIEKPYQYGGITIRVCRCSSPSVILLSVFQLLDEQSTEW
jgi:hypothetical protein